MWTLWRAEVEVCDLSLRRGALLIGDGLRTRPAGLEARCTWDATELASDGGRTDSARDGGLGDRALGRYPRAAASTPSRFDSEQEECSDGWRRDHGRYPVRSSGAYCHTGLWEIREEDLEVVREGVTGELEVNPSRLWGGNSSMGSSSSWQPGDLESGLLPPRKYPSAFK